MNLVWHPTGIEWIKQGGIARWLAVVHHEPYATDADKPSVRTQHLDDGVGVCIEKYGPDLPPEWLMSHVGHSGEFTYIGRRVVFRLGEDEKA